MELSRRNFVAAAAGSVAAGVAATATVGSVAHADEAGESYTYEDTIVWDAEYDVVVLGLGFAGIASAMAAANEGATVLVAEKCSMAEAGGNSRVCGQVFAYMHEDEDAAKQYYRALAGGREVSDEMIDFMATNIAHSKTLIGDIYGFDSSEFTEMNAYTDYVPEYPEFPGADQITMVAIHNGAVDGYFYQQSRVMLEEKYMDKIDVWFESPAVALIQDPISKTVIGVCIERNGETRAVRALNGVCVCTGGFEDDKEMVQNYLDVINYAPLGGLYNTGDGIKMCQAINAKLWHMSAVEGGQDLISLTYDVPEGMNGLSISSSEMKTGATIVVGDWGRRYNNESCFCRHGHMADRNGIWEYPRFPQSSYVIWDKTQYDAIMEAGVFNNDYADTVCECATIAEAAEAIGCDEENLQETIDNYNCFVEAGIDYEWARDIDTMRAFDGEAYYVMPVKASILNTQGGPERNIEAQILDMENNPIPNLYSAGEMGGFTACMYQGSTNVAECWIMGHVAGTNAAVPKNTVLPAYTLEPKVESNPAHFGEESDLVPFYS